MWVTYNVCCDLGEIQPPGDWQPHSSLRSPALPQLQACCLFDRLLSKVPTMYSAQRHTAYSTSVMTSPSACQQLGRNPSVLFRPHGPPSHCLQGSKGIVSEMGGEEDSKWWTQFAEALHNRVEHVHGVIVPMSAITEERDATRPKAGSVCQGRGLREVLKISVPFQLKCAAADPAHPHSPPHSLPYFSPWFFSPFATAWILHIRFLLFICPCRNLSP